MSTKNLQYYHVIIICMIYHRNQQRSPDYNKLSSLHYLNCIALLVGMLSDDIRHKYSIHYKMFNFDLIG